MELRLKHSGYQGRCNNNFTRFLGPTWPLQKVSTQLLGIGTLSQVRWSSQCIKCIRPLGQIKAICGRYSHEQMGMRSTATVGSTDQHSPNFREKLQNRYWKNVIKDSNRLFVRRTQHRLAIQIYEEAHCWQNTNCPTIICLTDKPV